MGAETDIPRIRRDIQILPAQTGNQSVYIVQDDLGLCPADLTLMEDSLVTLAVIGTKKTIREVQADLVRLSGGSLISTDEIHALIRKFDDLFLLETPRYHQTRRALMLEYNTLLTRESRLAGTVYPDMPDELRALLETVIGHDRPDVTIRDRTVAIVAPHIDLNVAKPTYGQAYRYWPDTPPERIVMLGTGHSMSQDYFSLTFKDYQTPLGPLRTDRETVAMLKSRLGGGVAYTDFAHKNEHSLEMQSIFIRHLIGDRDIPVIPILCGSFAELLTSVERAADFIQVAGFFAALKEIIRKPGVFTVVGVDLSHIGPKFGHRKSARSMERDAQAHDRQLISTLTRVDPKAFWHELRHIRDRFNVCGASSLATFLECAGPVEGELLEYRMVHEAPTDSAVGCAAMVFRKKDVDPTIEGSTHAI